MLRVENLCVTAGEFRLQDIQFTVGAGAYAVLMGSTGCGKTTLLEAICGLRQADAGSVFLKDRPITRTPAALRGIGYVPQDAAVFPRMTVRENLAFSLQVRGESRQQQDSAAQRLAEQLSLTHLMDRRGDRLSGGESQRVALGRALAARPQLLLLDEPLAALDEATRATIVELLRRVQSDSGVTTLHVTHSRTEAELLADEVLTIRNGQIEPDAAAAAQPTKTRSPSTAPAIPGAQ
ncbi:MAG: ATP-binding cassette domain-containing protein [Planctomycetota bacterium]